MSSYLEKITAVQKEIDFTYGVLDIYKNSRLNNGWINTNSTNNIFLSKFNTYFDDNSIGKISNNIDATLFDIPMSSRGYDKYGNFGAGIPSDIGFTKNVEQDENGNYIPHSPLYMLTSDKEITGYASNSANTSIGGIVKYKITNAGIEVFPNDSEGSFIYNPIKENWLLTDNFFAIIPKDNSNNLHMLYCFVYIDLSNLNVTLYITSNFIEWNTHCLLSGVSENNTELYMELFAMDNNIDNLQNILYKYFKILPNNNYLIMYPEDICNETTDDFVLANLYSPLIKESLLSIKNPYKYDSENRDQWNIAINGFSSYMTENGEVVFYLNNASEDKTPLILYNGRTMGTFTGPVSDNYKHDIIDSPKVAKIYDMQINKTAPYTKTVDNMTMDCAISIMESKNRNLTNDDIPAASVQLALGDIGRPYEDKMDDQIVLHVDKNIDMMDNIDVDFSEYIYSKNINGENYLSGNVNMTNSISWTECAISDTSRRWESVCYGNGKFVVVAYNSNIFAYSTDGINWTEGTISDTSRKWKSLCYSDGKFVAVADDTMFAYSTDGINWTEGTISDTSRRWESVCYGNGKFVVVAYNSNIFAYSTDGINWTEGTISDTSRFWYSVCYGDGKFVAVEYFNRDIFAYSTDGINWTEGTISDTSRYWLSICYGNGKYIIVGDSNVFAYSTDGINWTEGTISDTTSGWYSVCYGNGKFVAIAADFTSVDGYTNTFAYSTDGITWTEGNVNDKAPSCKSVCYGNGKFVISSSSSNSVTTLESIYFSQRAIISNNNKLTIFVDPLIYNTNVRYRSSIIGNTLVSDLIKDKNNPSLGKVY